MSLNFLFFNTYECSFPLCLSVSVINKAIKKHYMQVNVPLQQPITNSTTEYDTPIDYLRILARIKALNGDHR